MQVHMSLHSETLKFPEECLKYELSGIPFFRYKRYLAKVKGHLSPQDFIAQEDPQASDVGAVARKVDNLRPVALLFVALDCQPLQLWSNCSKQCSDIIKPHGNQVQLNQVFKPQQWSPNSAVGIIQDRDLVVYNKVHLPQLGTSGHHQLYVFLDLSALARMESLLVTAASRRFA